LPFATTTRRDEDELERKPNPERYRRKRVADRLDPGHGHVRVRRKDRDVECDEAERSHAAETPDEETNAAEDLEETAQEDEDARHREECRNDLTKPSPCEVEDADRGR